MNLGFNGKKRSTKKGTFSTIKCISKGTELILEISFNTQGPKVKLGTK